MMVYVLKCFECVCPVLLLNHLHLFQLCRSRKMGYKQLPCNFTARSQGGFLQVGGVIVHSPEKRASEGNSLSEYSNYLVNIIL